ncbi:MAG: hypothetical protein ACRDQA_19855 [Nocardioidaceae bacterium]
MVTAHAGLRDLWLLALPGLATAALIVPVAVLPGPWVWVAVAALGVAVFLINAPAVLIGQDLFPDNPSMGSGIALGLANAIGALLVLAVGLWVTAGTFVTFFWVLAGLTAASTLLALAFAAPLMTTARSDGHRQQDHG